MDELILIENNNSFLQHIVSPLGNRFSFKELCGLHYFLRVEVISVKKGFFFFFLSQNYYVHDLLIGLKMDGAQDV